MTKNETATFYVSHIDYITSRQQFTVGLFNNVQAID